MFFHIFFFSDVSFARDFVIHFVSFGRNIRFQSLFFGRVKSVMNAIAENTKRKYDWNEWTCTMRMGQMLFTFNFTLFFFGRLFSHWNFKDICISLFSLLVSILLKTVTQFSSQFDCQLKLFAVFIWCWRFNENLIRNEVDRNDDTIFVTDPLTGWFVMTRRKGCVHQKMRHRLKMNRLKWAFRIAESQKKLFHFFVRCDQSNFDRCAIASIIRNKRLCNFDIWLRLKVRKRKNRFPLTSTISI